MGRIFYFIQQCLLAAGAIVVRARTIIAFCTSAGVAFTCLFYMGV